MHLFIDIEHFYSAPSRSYSVALPTPLWRYKDQS